MKQVSEDTTATWLSGDYTGARRPIVRATIAKWRMKRTPYSLRWSTSADWHHDGKFNTSIFNQTGGIRELRNIKSIKWTRSIDQDIATCEIVLYNVQYRRDVLNEHDEEFDFPGWYTPNRGTGSNDPWDYDTNEWRNWIVPDRMIRTYEGYGIDSSVCPEDDPNMYPSGVWLIDEVSFATSGLITLSCRDVGSLLMNQPIFLPTIPHQIYPLWWEAFETKPRSAHLEPKAPFLKPDWQKDSNEFVLDAGLMDGTVPAVSDSGNVYGHKGKYARDSDPTTFWLSAGSSEPNQLEWIQFNMDPTDVAGVRVNVRGGPYLVYVSVYNEDLGWRGASKIPYTVAADGVDNNAGIRFVTSHKMAIGEVDKFKLPRTFHNITKIRFTFASQWNSGIGQERLYRTALQEIAYTTDTEMVDQEGTKQVGNYGDYTDIIKWLVSWGGLYWPPDATLKKSDGTIVSAAYDEPDTAVLPVGRAWGDFENTATTGFARLETEMWDKKPITDGISAIRDITGFDFWIDETGGVIWRMPNVWVKGNYLTPAAGGDDRGRTAEVIEIDERTTLMELSAKISSRNIRERVFVADVNGRFGTVVKGYNPHPTGQRRTSGWTDQYFKNLDEAKRVADLIAIRQAFFYRQSQITIAANPALQVDDQIIIYERMAGERYLHRIHSISSEFDYETGKWTYQLNTQWLGDEAYTERAWEPTTLSDVTRWYLNNFNGGG